MDLIIAGAGRVGHLLAKTLCLRHNVTIIDKNAEILQVLQESVDLLTITGDIEDPDTYSTLLNRRFDIFIAVTDSDEANLLSTLIADDAIDTDKKIIRLKNDYFARSSISEKLGISDAVFPFRATAESIRALFDFPRANNVKSFEYTDYKLISVFVHERVAEASSVAWFNSDTSVIVGIEREKHFFIPDEEEEILPHDLLYFFGDPVQIRRYCELIDTRMPEKIERIAIFGADLLGIEIAKVLLDRGVQLKIIEKDAALCRRASEILQDRATVIHSRYVEHIIYEEEQIGQSDMIISTDTKDETNIIRCLEAKEYGIRKTVAINNNTDYYDLMHKLDIVAARGPKTNAFYAILEKIGSSTVIFEKHYCGGRGVIFQRRIFENSPLIGKIVKPCKAKKSVAFILRGGVLLPFIEKMTLEADDLITLFLDSEEEERVKRWIYAL